MSGLQKKLEEVLKESERKMKQAFDRTPKEYHDYIIQLEQNQKIANYEAEDLAKKHDNVFCYKNGTYVKVQNPYIGVDGRLQMFADAHKKEDGTRYKYKIKSNLGRISRIIEKNGDVPPHALPLIVKIESELFGTLEGESRIFWKQGGPHASNPIEVAKTSALGRAISQAGIGLLGSGIASAEEVVSAMSYVGNDEQPPKEPKEPKKQSSGKKQSKPKTNQKASKKEEAKKGTQQSETAKPADKPSDKKTDVAEAVEKNLVALKYDKSGNGKEYARIAVAGESGEAEQGYVLKEELINALKDAKPEKNTPVKVAFEKNNGGINEVTQLEVVESA